MHRHLSVALSAATAVAAIGLSGCSHSEPKVAPSALRHRYPPRRVRHRRAPPTAPAAAARSPYRRAEPARRPERSGHQQGEPRRRRNPGKCAHPGQVHQRIARQRLPADDLRGKQHRMVGQKSVQRDGDGQRQHRPGEHRCVHFPDGIHALPRWLAVITANCGNAVGPGQLTVCNPAATESAAEPGTRPATNTCPCSGSRPCSGTRTRTDAHA